jgi:beta-glucanase (GH16 family)
MGTRGFIVNAFGCVTRGRELSGRRGRIALAVGIAGLAAFSGAPARATAPLEPASGVLFGAWHKNLPADTWTTTEFARFESLVGRRLDIDHRYHAWGSAYWPGAPDRWDVTGGRIPMASLGGSKFPGLDAVVNGSQDTYLTALADRIRAFGSRMFFRPLWEMNGDWMPWGGPRNNSAGLTDGPAKYVRAWRRMHDIFVQRGATNAVWVWSPNCADWPKYSYNRFAGYYPGDAYVDWVGCDEYNWGTARAGNGWQSWAELFGGTASVYSTYPHKPFMVAETGSCEQGGDKARWLRDMHRDVKASFPNVKAVVYFDEFHEQSINCDWRVTTSAGALDAYRAMGAEPYFGGASAAPAPTPEPTLVWSDEFNAAAGALPNVANWSMRTGGRWMHGGTRELQCYTARAANVSHDGAGNLRIVARHEPGYTGCADGPNDYTSARIDGKLKRAFQYGRIEARIKVPAARGAWPAWWSVGSTGTWPGAGETDILEYRPGPAPLDVRHAVHGATTAGAHWQRSFATSAGAPWSDGFHVYGTLWSQGRIAFQIDGATRWTVTPADLSSGAVWAFDKAFYLLLNQAVGNRGCEGAPSPCPDPSQFPSEMLVDWVRVYQDQASTPAPTPTPTPTPTPSPAPGADPYIIGAGDIAASNGGSAATANLLDVHAPAAAWVYTTGDNAYPDGTTANYNSYYQPTWGRWKAKTKPVPGNHEYHRANAADYFAYFGAAAGTPGKGWYSYDVGAWHIVALNSSRATDTACTPVPCNPGSEQYEWLKADLAAHPNKCVAAIWHHPLYSRGSYDGVNGVKPMWDLLYDMGADVVLNGHDHNYQRYAPLNKAGVRDDLRGIREFVAGEGGNSEYSVAAPGGNLEASQSGTRGLLMLTLHPDSYEWRFVHVAGKTYIDAGSGSCH